MHPKKSDLSHCQVIFKLSRVFIFRIFNNFFFPYKSQKKTCGFKKKIIELCLNFKLKYEFKTQTLAIQICIWKLFKIVKNISGSYHDKITHLDSSLMNFTRLVKLDFSRNALLSLNGLSLVGLDIFLVFFKIKTVLKH